MESSFEILSRLRRRCELTNSPREYRDGGPQSPYSQSLEDPVYNAKEWLAGFDNSLGPLENYLAENCRDRDIRMEIGRFLESCGNSPSTVIKVLLQGFGQVPGMDPRAISPELYQTRSMKIRLRDWSRFRITADPSAFQIGPENPEHSCQVRGSCPDCCKDESVNNKAFLFGGPDGDIIIGQIPVSMSCNATGDCGGSNGDPHMCTHDGLKYDFHGVGEFVLSRTDDFEVQARHGSVWKYAAFNSAAAVKIKGSRVAVYGGQPAKLTVNGEDFELEVGEEVRLPGGASLRRDESTYRVSADGYVFEAMTQSDKIGAVRVRVPEGTKSVGLLGNRNGSRVDDLMPSAGPALQFPVSFEDLYRKFGDSWRVTSRTSLFDYAFGESPDTFADPTLPLKRVTAKQLNKTMREQAEEICKNAGVTDESNLEDCVFDVALTGDPGYAEIARLRPLTIERLAFEDEKQPEPQSATYQGTTFSLPTEAFASYPVEITISGNERTGLLTFAKPGSRPTDNVGNPYSAIVLRGDEESVSIRAPYFPGNYELRLISQDRDRTIHFRLPFRSKSPEAEIVAAEEAEVGGSIEVTVFGDVSPFGKIAVVEVGAPDSESGREKYLSGGFIDRTVVDRLPEKPGVYEIRYMSQTSGAVYARRRLRLR
ncbi:MAG: VWD domain-containing protein [Aridibacter famidurans]|nr:VWD domain-containing protein [Aridibacter famidurans]